MTPALTKHLRPAYAECGGVFMKKNRLIAAGLLGLLWLPGLALGQEEDVQQAKPATVWQDLYYSRQEKKDLIISADDKVPHSIAVSRRSTGPLS